ncbi:MAG: hypothetical protein ACRDLA_00665 [Thermoleophilaceae bacterium]
MVTVVDPGDGRKAVRHLDPGCPELMCEVPSLVLGRMAATRAVRVLTVRCLHCFAETERREAAERERRAGREASRGAHAPPSAGPAVNAPRRSDATARHLVTIARCPNVAACLDGGVPGHPCATIVLNQWDGVSREERLGRWRQAHQLPEPWDGHLETAPILFVSSNPSISGSVQSLRPPELERDPPISFMGRSVADHPSIRRLGQGPRWSWSDDEIVDRYESAFDLYIAEGVAGRLPDGTTAGPTRFWIEVRSRARELLPECEVRPGVDYALTEALRCKSRHEIGVEEALATCSSLSLRDTVAASGAVVIVVLGRLAARAIAEQLRVSPQQRLHEGVLVGERRRAHSCSCHTPMLERCGHWPTTSTRRDSTAFGRSLRVQYEFRLRQPESALSGVGLPQIPPHSVEKACK